LQKSDTDKIQALNLRTQLKIVGAKYTKIKTFQPQDESKDPEIGTDARRQYPKMT